MIKMSSNGQHFCRDCTKSFHSGHALNTHNDTVHNIDGHMKCKRCQAKFEGYHQTVKHFDKIHSEDNVRTCIICEKTFTTSSARNLHVRKYHSRKNIIFPCSLCTRTFRDKGSRARHFDVEHMGSAFQCNICSKVLKYSSHFSDHIDRHETKIKSRTYLLQ